MAFPRPDIILLTTTSLVFIESLFLLTCHVGRLISPSFSPKRAIRVLSMISEILIRLIQSPSILGFQDMYLSFINLSELIQDRSHLDIIRKIKFDGSQSSFDCSHFLNELCHVWTGVDL